MSDVYYNIKHPAGFASITKLAKATGLSQKVVKEWFKEQPALHRQQRCIVKLERSILPDSILYMRLMNNGRLTWPKWV